MKGIISFYENPGSGENTKQKEILTEAGYKLQVIDILTRKWERESLEQFIGDQSVHACIDIKSSLIAEKKLDIDGLTEEELLNLMVDNPALIKSPLLFYRGEFGIGFESDLVARLLDEK